MPKQQNALKYGRQKSVIYLSFLLLFSIPLVVFGILKGDFDIRNRAFDDLELSDKHQCLISFPNVNVYSLEKGKEVTVVVEAKIKDDYAKQLKIYDGDGEIVYQEYFDNSPIEISTNFTYIPKTSGIVDMTGKIEKGTSGLVSCVITSPSDIIGLMVIPSNTAPEFISKPSQSIPSQNILTGDMYEYTLTAEDIDNDGINYSYSFTPRADWLKPIIIDDGSKGKLTIKFKGSTNKAASYLAHVLIHDGYSTNVRTQSWIINVSPEENDIPVVRVIEPELSLRIDKGVSFRSSWETTDLNHIVKHDLYISNNPTNKERWIPISEDIPSDQTDYDVTTSNLTPGTYQLIVQSTDNQQPPASGIGLSPEIVISGTGDDKGRTDDSVILKQPHIVNMSPDSGDEVENRRVTIRVTIVAGEGAKINEDTISFTLNDKDFTKDIKLNKISDAEYSVIFQPTDDLNIGINQANISFKDSNGEETSKSWNFKIAGEKEREMLEIFGFEISQTTILIVSIGAVTILLALVVPFIIFSIWKGDKRKDDTIPYQSDKLPASIPKDSTIYTDTKREEPELLREKVTQVPLSIKEEKKEDVWDSYSAPTPQTLDEEQEVELPKVEVPEETEITPPPEQHLEETPSIPEPEIPDAQDLQKIFEQIQQSQNENEEKPTEVVKE